MRYYILSYFIAVAGLLFIFSCSAKEPTPILVLANDSNYGSYTGEILKAEGFNEFKIASPDELAKLRNLNQFDLVILSETSLSDVQKKLLSDYVEGGGCLIAFRPDKSLYHLFGITYTGNTIKEGYVRIDTANRIGKGLVSQTIQFHGTSDLCRLDGGMKIADLYKDGQNMTEFPSLVVNNYGKGKTAAFTYNLPQSIVYTRQGNPDWAGEERDKVDGPTATDLFFPRPGEKQWNDPSKIAIPQADEQMRLLSHILEEFSSNKKPLPRLWYFPDDYQCIFIFTIDGENNTEQEINNEILDVQSQGGNATLYEIGTYISLSRVKEWRSNGNEVAIHYNDVPNYANPTNANMKTVIDTMTKNFINAYGYLPETVRNHWVVWVSKDSTGKKEFAEQAKLEAKAGIGMDCNYYQFGGNKVYPNWMGDVGHITGSGLPMKFADSRGHILDIYQSNTQLPDETWLKENIESKSKIMIDRSVDEENYTWINANYHTWYWPETRPHGLKVLEYCRSRGVPVWTAEKVYDFIKMKDEASFSSFNWKNNELSFTLKSSLSHPNGLTIMLPEVFQSLKIKRILRDETTLPFKAEKVKGYDYTFVTVKPGHVYRFSILYAK